MWGRHDARDRHCVSALEAIDALQRFTEHGHPLAIALDAIEFAEDVIVSVD